MTIQVMLEPELEERVVEAAKRRGVSIEEYAKKTLTEMVQVDLVDSRKRLSTEEFLDAIAYRGPIDPSMASQEISREFIYGDHA
jgi:hypothetical protein